MTEKYFIDQHDMWDLINDAHEGEKFPGIYKLHVTDAEEKFLLLPRLFGVDKEGVLYIGTSEVVQHRAANVRKSICAAYKKINPEVYAEQKFSDPKVHQTGKKIVRLPKFVEVFPLSRLCLTVTRYTGVDDLEFNAYGHFSLEEKLLQEYEQRFGEKPPLNS